MARYSSGGGTFAKFEEPGTSYEGKFAGSRMVSGQYGNKLVVDIIQGDGSRISVDMGLRALEAQWSAANAERPVAQGERLKFVFEKRYDSKKFGKNRGKDVAIDFLDRPEAGQQPTPATPPASAPAAQEENAEVAAAYALVVKAKGEEAAKAIKAAVQNVAKGDHAKQADLLRKAVGQ